MARYWVIRFSFVSLGVQGVASTLGVRTTVLVAFVK